MNARTSPGCRRPLVRSSLFPFRPLPMGLVVALWLSSLLIPSIAVAADQPGAYAYFAWGHPQFTEGDLYTYTRPDWVLFSYKLGGEWTAGPAGWYVGADAPTNTGRLIVEINRERVNADVRYLVRYFDSTGSLYIDLLDTNGVAVVEDVAGENLLSGTGRVVERDVLLPLAANSDAWVISLRAAGPVLVLESLVYWPDRTELSGGALLNAARSALSESVAGSTGPGDEAVTDATATATEDGDAAAGERQRERARRGERTDTEGRVNLRVFTMIE